MTPSFKLGLVGWPLIHSLSPLLHMAAFDSCGWGGEYCLFPIPALPSGRSEMDALLLRLREGELDGLNVTIPHKLPVITLLDELLQPAAEIGAVNTVIRSDQKLVGGNTDAQGFMLDFQSKFPMGSPGNAVVIGAGGGARAVVYALASKGWQVQVISRDPAQARVLVAHFTHTKPSPVAIPQPLADVTAAVKSRDIQLLVNTTPLGMLPFDQLSPWPDNTTFPGGCSVYDLVYDPPETPFLRQARQQGIPTANGLGMLVNQAALAFMMWTWLPKAKFPHIQRAMLDAVSTPTGKI